MMPKTERFFDLAHSLLMTFMLIVIFQFLASWYINGSAFPLDATDGPSDRSGFALKTDYGTGCEYLARNGALTPRMTKDGKQSGCR